MKKELREKIWLKCNKRCAYCGYDIEYKDMQVDHFYPQSWPGHLAFDRKKGKTEIESIDHYDNLMPSCRACNFYKSADHPEQFRKNMLSLHERITKINFIVKLGIKYDMVKIKPFDGRFYYECFIEIMNSLRRTNDPLP